MTYLRRYSLFFWALIFGVLMVMYPKGQVNAYLDPGTGSLILQLIIGGLLGSVLFIRVFWGKISRKVRGSGSTVEEDLDSVADSTAAPGENGAPPLS